jgi:HEAT repeat protein
VSSATPPGQDDARLLASRSDRFAEEAIERIVKLGPKALPALEMALHGAKPSGRKNCVRAMQKMASPAATPLLRHLAKYDEDAEVRAAAKAALN